jgi:hypothetical protein
MEPFNNSFPCSYFQDKYENMDVDMEERSNLSAFNLNFLKFSDNLGENTNVNEINEINEMNEINDVKINVNNTNHLINTCNNFNFSPPKKKNSLDISYSMEQTFYENSHINIEEEFQPNEETCNNI